MSVLMIDTLICEAVTTFEQINWHWGELETETVSHTLVEHVRLVSEGCVLAQVLSDHLHPLQLQPLQLLRKTRRKRKRGGGEHVSHGEISAGTNIKPLRQEANCCNCRKNWSKIKKAAKQASFTPLHQHDGMESTPTPTSRPPCRPGSSC